MFVCVPSPCLGLNRPPYCSIPCPWKLHAPLGQKSQVNRKVPTNSRGLMTKDQHFGGQHTSVTVTRDSGLLGMRFTNIGHLDD